MFRHACALGLEGIVSKRLDKPYSSGRCHARPSGQSPTAEAQIAWAITVTEEAKVAAEEKRDQAQADLDGTRSRLSEWRKKLADTSLAPATLEKHARGGFPGLPPAGSACPGSGRQSLRAAACSQSRDPSVA